MSLCENLTSGVLPAVSTPPKLLKVRDGNGDIAATSEVLTHSEGGASYPWRVNPEFHSIEESRRLFTATLRNFPDQTGRRQQPARRTPRASGGKGLFPCGGSSGIEILERTFALRSPGECGTSAARPQVLLASWSSAVCSSLWACKFPWRPATSIPLARTFLASSSRPSLARNAPAWK